MNYPRTRAGQAIARENRNESEARRIDMERNDRIRRAVSIAMLANPEAGQAGAVKTIAERWGLADAEIRKALPGLESAC